MVAYNTNRYDAAALHHIPQRKQADPETGLLAEQIARIDVNDHYNSFGDYDG